MNPSPTSPRPPTSGAGPEPPASGPEPAAHRLYLRLAWGTLDGLPLLGPGRRLALEVQLAVLCHRLGLEPVEVAVRPDRVELLLRTTPAHAIAELVPRLKTASMESLCLDGTPVRWARGYAVSSLSPGDVRRVRRQFREREPGARSGSS